MSNNRESKVVYFHTAEDDEEQGSAPGGTGPAPTARRSSAGDGIRRDSPAGGAESHVVSIEMIESGQPGKQQEGRESQVGGLEAEVVSALMLDAARYLAPSPSPPSSPPHALDRQVAEEEQPLLQRWVTLGDRLGMSKAAFDEDMARESARMAEGTGPMATAMGHVSGPVESNMPPPFPLQHGPASSPPPPPPTHSPAPAGEPLAPLSLTATSFDASRLCSAVDQLTVEQAKLLLNYMDVLMRDHIVRQMSKAQIERRKRRHKQVVEKHGEEEEEEEGEEAEDDEAVVGGEGDGLSFFSSPSGSECRTPAPPGGERKMAEESKEHPPRAPSAGPPIAPFESVGPALPLPFHFPTLSNAHLAWRHLSLMRNDVMLLQRVSGFVECGSMMCVLGAADAGATPLLRSLAQQQEGHMHGDILINGLHIDDTKAKQAWRAIGFVSKDEIHLPTLTVSESLLLSAKLRLPATLPPLFVRLRVELVIRLLGLSRVRGSRIGDALIRGISGGERRRVSFACEMVSSAPLILADLPTNGLDSASALNLLEVVKETNGHNRGLMCSLVQPSMEMLRLFDTILLLSKGSAIYCGPLDDMEAHFTAIGFPRPPGQAFPEYVESLSADARRCWDRRTPLLKVFNLVGEAPTMRAWHHFDQQAMGNTIKPLAAWRPAAGKAEQTRNNNHKETRVATHGPIRSKEVGTHHMHRLRRFPKL